MEFTCSACASSSSGRCSIARSESSLRSDLGLDTDANTVPTFFKTLVRHCAEHDTGISSCSTVSKIAWGRLNASTRKFVAEPTLPGVQLKHIRWTLRRLLGSHELVPLEDAAAAYSRLSRRTADVAISDEASSEAGLLQNLTSLFSSLSVVTSAVGAVVGAVLGSSLEDGQAGQDEGEGAREEGSRESMLVELWDDWAGQVLHAIRAQCAHAADSSGILPLLEAHPSIQPAPALYPSTSSQATDGVQEPLSLPQVLHAAGGQLARFVHLAPTPTLSPCGLHLVHWLCYRGTCVGMVERAGIGRVLLLQVAQREQHSMRAVGSPGKGRSTVPLSPSSASSCAAPLLLRVHCLSLEARQGRAWEQGDRHRGKAKEHVKAGRREEAIRELKLSKLCEHQAKTAGDLLHTSTAALHALLNTQQAQAQAEALKVANAALQQGLERMPDLDAVMEDLQDGLDSSDALLARLSSPLGTGMGEDVEAELRDMEASMQAQAQGQLPAVPTHVPVASPRQPAAAAAVASPPARAAVPA